MGPNATRNSTTVRATLLPYERPLATSTVQYEYSTSNNYANTLESLTSVAPVELGSLVPMVGGSRLRVRMLF